MGPIYRAVLLVNSFYKCMHNKLKVEYFKWDGHHRVKPFSVLPGGKFLAGRDSGREEK